MNDDDDDATLPCPYCKSEIYEDAVQCPRCGQYISDEDAPAAAKPWWIIAGVLAALFAVYCWVTTR